MALRFVKAQNKFLQSPNGREYVQAVVVYDEVLIEQAMDGEIFSFKMDADKAREFAATLIKFAAIAENGENY